MVIRALSLMGALLGSLLASQASELMTIEDLTSGSADERYENAKRLVEDLPPVQWAAVDNGTLERLLKAMEQAHARPLVELGLRTTGSSTAMPAFSGDLWQGMDALSQRFGLTYDIPGPSKPIPSRNRSDRRWAVGMRGQTEPAKARHAGLLLRKPDQGDDQFQPVQANGSVALQLRSMIVHDAQSSSGHRRWVDLGVGLALDPRIPMGAIDNVRVNWSEVTADVGSPTLRRLTTAWDRWGRQREREGLSENGLYRLEVSGLTPDTTRIQLKGRAVLVVQPEWRDSYRLTLGESVPLNVGEKRGSLTYNPPAGNARGATLTLMLPADLLIPPVEIQASGAGTKIPMVEIDNGVGQSGTIWQTYSIPWAAVAGPPITVTLGGKIACGEIAVPLILDVEIP